jgi:tetratricopeptide (TPR) repeat protein
MDTDPSKITASPAPVFSERAARGWRKRALVAGSILVLLIGVGLWAAHSRRSADATAPSEPRPSAPSPDPRLEYAGPFRNVRPDVRYVGDARCAECHQDKVLSYSRHPMGRSFAPASQVVGQQRFDSATHNPFEALGTLFMVQRQGERLVHRQIGRDDQGQTVYEADWTIDYVLGSGEQGCSFLSERDGFLYQSPVSWYSQKQIWDVSPGLGHPRTGRPITGRCLYCHANRANAREETINGYTRPIFEGFAIGCERCHGPASLHLQEPGHKDPETGVDYTIVNPRHLKPQLRESVCEQCHLAGTGRVLRRGRGMYDFRPGLPLSDFWSVFLVEAGPQEKRKAVGHVEQMYRSRCFLRSVERPETGERKLGCTSCHDPHLHIGADKRVAYYRQMCLACHHEQGCSEPLASRRQKSKEDSCIDCHMPRFPSSDIAHTAATDHRILRRPQVPGSSDSSRPDDEPRFDSFYSQRAEDHDKERDLGIAMTQFYAQREAAFGRVVDVTVSLLQGAVTNDPSDLEAWESLALTLTFLRRHTEALAAYEAVLAQAPSREIALARAAMLADALNQFERARDYWRRAVEVHPRDASSRKSLAKALAHQGAWTEARPHCQAWLELDPADIEARELWVRCLIRTGEKAKARQEFKKIERLRPPNLPVLKARFDVEIRSR